MRRRDRAAPRWLALAALLAGCLADTPAPEASTPVVNLEVRDTDDRVLVISAARDADWDRIAASLTGGTGVRMGAAGDCNLTPRGCQNAAATSAGVSLPVASRVQVASGPDPMDPGDYVEFCGAGEPRPNVAIHLWDTTSNADLGLFNFAQVALC